MSIVVDYSTVPALDLIGLAVSHDLSIPNRVDALFADSVLYYPVLYFSHCGPYLRGLPHGLRHRHGHSHHTARMDVHRWADRAARMLVVVATVVQPAVVDRDKEAGSFEGGSSIEDQEDQELEEGHVDREGA